MHRHTTTDQPTPEQIAALLDRADRNVAAQGDAYGTELDDDHAWRCAWNTWRTLQDLTAAVRSLVPQRDAADVIQLHTDRPTPEPTPLGRTA